MSRRLIALLFFVNIAIWSAAGYYSGLAKGKGWRAAIVNGQCRVVCPNIVAR